MHSNKSALLIFIKNPIKGKVKTRLAQSIGDDRALYVYHRLLEHTRNITTDLSDNIDKFLFYSNFIPAEEDEWSNHVYQKKLQVQGGLGEKMQTAFIEGFKHNYENLIIIGSDCWELEVKHLEEAFEQLLTHDVVLGPAKDGGYYLLGMKQLHTAFFTKKEWSTDTVLTRTLADVKKKGLSHHLLPILSDVDYEEDLEDTGLLRR